MSIEVAHNIVKQLGLTDSELRELAKVLREDVAPKPKKKTVG
ncbi:MAG: hypothetical protein AAF348_11575 [Bacteroidota bacterium]